MPYSLLHLFSPDKVLGTIPGLAIWSVSCCSWRCSNKCISFLLLPPQILQSVSPTWRLSVSFLPYATAGNENELHENKEEFALQKCFITQSVSVCIIFWGWSHAGIANSKGSAVQQESHGLFLNGVKKKGIPFTPWAKVMNDTACFPCGCGIKCEMEVGCSCPGENPIKSLRTVWESKGYWVTVWVCYTPRRSLPFS